MNQAAQPSATHLAIFDLDNTLLAADSDYLWGEYLVERGIVEAEAYARENQRFYDEYKAGTLDIHAFIRFSLEPLRKHSAAELSQWHEDFMARKILPIIAPQTQALLDSHRNAGHELLIITATNRFVTAPIARALGIDHLLATDPEIRDGQYTGEIDGIPCFQDGKIKRLEIWLAERDWQPESNWFYSDSHNDLPLLRKADYPVAVDPDDALRKVAVAEGWPVVSLRGSTFPDELLDSIQA